MLQYLILVDLGIERSIKSHQVTGESLPYHDTTTTETITFQ